MRLFCIFLFAAFPLFSAVAQVLPRYTLSARAHYGFVVPHRESMTYLIDGHAKGGTLTLSRQTDGEKEWQKRYNYPVLGVQCYYMQLGNPTQMGNATGLISFLDFPVRRAPRFYAGFQLGTGLGYLTKHFDAENNYKNNAIGSHLNGIIHAAMETQFFFQKKISLSAGLALTHFSNGAYRMPNLGINIPTIYAGVMYRFSEVLLQQKDSIPVSEKQSIRVYMFIMGGLKEVYPAGSEKYTAYTVSLPVLKPLGYKSAVGGGVDFFYDKSLQQKFRNDSIPSTTKDLLRAGIFLAHELMVSKFTIVACVGMYAIDAWKKDGSVYDRIGFRYKISEHILFNFTLKTHLSKADNIELGIGYRF